MGRERKLTRKDKIAQSGHDTAPKSGYAEKQKQLSKIALASCKITVPGDINVNDVRSDLSLTMMINQNREYLVRQIELIARNRTPVFVYYEGARSLGNKLVFRIAARDQFDARFTVVHAEGALSEGYKPGFFFDLDDVHKFIRGCKSSSLDRANFVGRIVGRFRASRERISA